MTTGYGEATTNSYYFIKDHLGTVHAVTDSSGDIVEEYKYDAWGRVLGVYDTDGIPLAESAIGNPYLFQGRWYSWALHKAMGGSGLYFFRTRGYDPVVGRWLSKDPIGVLGGLNQYIFCGNSPVNSVDPDALDTRWRHVEARHHPMTKVGESELVGCPTAEEGEAKMVWGEIVEVTHWEQWKKVQYKGWKYKAPERCGQPPPKEPYFYWKKELELIKWVTVKRIGQETPHLMTPAEWQQWLRRCGARPKRPGEELEIGNTYE